MAEEKTEETSNEGGNKSGGSKMLMIIIGAVVVVLLLVGVGLVVLLSGGSSEAQANTPQHVAAKSGGGGGNSGVLPLNIGPLYPIEGSIVVNLISTSSQKRFLKTSITLELSHVSLKAEMDKKIDAVKDTIISIMSSKSAEEVQTTKGKEKLKEEIMSRLNEFLVDGRISNIFFTEFVVS